MYPELVVRDAKGRIQSVRYLELTALLLSELQKERRESAYLETQLAAVEAAQAQANVAFNQRLRALERPENLTPAIARR